MIYAAVRDAVVILIALRAGRPEVFFEINTIVGIFWAVVRGVFCCYKCAMYFHNISWNCVNAVVGEHQAIEQDIH